MKKVVYVTGCLGFIGAYITRACLEKGWYVKGIDKITYASRPELLKEFKAKKTKQRNSYENSTKAEDQNIVEGDNVWARFGHLKGKYVIKTFLYGTRTKDDYKLNVKVKYYADESKYEHKENIYKCLKQVNYM